MESIILLASGTDKRLIGMRLLEAFRKFNARVRLVGKRNERQAGTEQGGEVERN